MRGNRLDRHEGKVAVITGGASGLGAASAIRLAEHGVNVVLADRKDTACADDVVKQCRDKGVGALAVQADVSRDEDCVRVAQAALDAFGRIDILVNCAATTRFAAHDDLHALEAQDFLDVYAVNLVGPYQMIRACAPAMKAHGRGAIVNISSTAGVLGIGSSVAYAASKGALLTMTKLLARALAPEIRINAVCPGFMATPWLSEHFSPERYEALLESAKTSRPIQEAGTADYVADAVVFLCLEGSRYITGETIMSDGGHHLGLGV
jgi:3-oxoacyl-[acyl-carrier protein] reductase